LKWHDDPFGNATVSQPAIPVMSSQEVFAGSAVHNHPILASIDKLDQDQVKPTSFTEYLIICLLLLNKLTKEKMTVVSNVNSSMW